MGPKASTSEKPVVSAVVEPLEEVKSTSPPNRNIRSAYLKRIGIGGGASTQKGTTLREFKVPKWLEQYSGEEEVLSDNETLQNIASNESYNLNFIQVKSNDEIRMGLLRKMSKAGFWKPPSERPPSDQASKD